MVIMPTFFKCMKAKACINSITILKDKQGRMMHKASDIEYEVLQYYKELLGSTAPRLPAIDIPNIRRGSKADT